MTDNFPIAHELLTKLKKKKKGKSFEVAVKVGLNKAYDRIRWDFILKIL